MRRIERSTAFKRDYKREAAGRHRRALETDFPAIVEALAQDRSLPARLRDHSLSGDWAGYRECHVRPDLLLIYGRSEGALRLVRLGSHSELF